jgi:GH24 family phage-related lysozyme (muramidase)
MGFCFLKEVKMKKDFIKYLRNKGLSVNKACKEELTELYNLIDSVVFVELNSKQRDALASFILSEGESNFVKSELLKAINNNESQSQIIEQWGKWIYKKHKVEQCLITLRQAEIAYYFDLA